MNICLRRAFLKYVFSYVVVTFFKHRFHSELWMSAVLLYPLIIKMIMLKSSFWQITKRLYYGPECAAAFLKSII